MNDIKLTQYSHGAGCGCKISPAVLKEILSQCKAQSVDPKLLVGNENLDDAAVYDLGDGTAVISTTDFFMPIVDDPYAFGRIAAINAISDVYAMGGKPLMAIAILGWPVDRLPAAVAGDVVDGGREACREAGILLAGGHSIDSPEPLFGLAVTGRVRKDFIKRNSTAKAGSRLYLTKPLGVGILTTAQKQGKLKEEHCNVAMESMLKLNDIGPELAAIHGVTAMTDVTGFGLLGHLGEICEGSRLSAEIELPKIPCLPHIGGYIAQKCIPGGTYRNWESYGQRIRLPDKNDRFILCDPQTSGGLLVAVEEQAMSEVEDLMAQHGIEVRSFGRLVARSEILIDVL